VKFGECLLVEVILHPLRLPGYRASRRRHRGPPLPHHHPLPPPHGV